MDKLGALVLLLMAVNLRGDEVTRDFCHQDDVRVASPWDSSATMLSIDNCNIRSLEPSLFHGLPNLDSIRLEKNHINRINSTVFRAVSNISQLVLYGNELREMLVFEIPFPNLSELTFFNNSITAVTDPYTFAGAVKVQYLHLGTNLIKNIHPEAFLPLRDLKELYLDNNKIEFIPEPMFQIKSLKKLILNNNLLEHVSPGAFLGAQLEVLRLDNNRLSYLPANFASQLTSGGSLQSFRISYNSWHCACLLEQLAEVRRLGVRDFDIYWDQQLSGTEPACVFNGRTCDRRLFIEK